jgi:hypothetical protein
MRAAYLVSMVALLALSGCTVVHVDGAGAVVQPGALQILPPENNAIIAIETRGIGIVGGLRGTTIGYHRESAVLQPAGNGCTVIVFDANLDDAGRDFWAKLAKDRRDICVK